MDNSIISDPSSLTNEYLVEEYQKLTNLYKNMKKSCDEDQQTIYELKRSLKTAESGEAFLSSELESIQSVHDKEIETLNSKHLETIEELKNNDANYREISVTLENQAEEMRNEISDLKEKLLKVNSSNFEDSNKRQSTSCDIERELRHEKEKIELLTLIDELKDNLEISNNKVINYASQIDCLKNKVECVEENLQSKRDELEEKNVMLEDTQEKMIELNAEIAVYKNAPEEANKKGNSLFAEVDDQRQKMKSILAAQNKQYLQMKKKFTEREFEIRHLKRENSAMQKEVEICKSIFLTADKNFKSKLNERIGQLVKSNEELEKKMTWTNMKLAELAKDKGIDWLDSMLQFCKNETTELKEQLYSSRLQKASLEETLFNSEQDQAKWRFEALKSRCILINRENILEEHKIPFPAIVTPKILTSDEIHQVKPDILSFIETSPTNLVDQSVLMETSKESNPDCSPPLPKKFKFENDVDDAENEENDSNIQNIPETKMEVDEIIVPSKLLLIEPTSSVLSPTSILSDSKDKDFCEKKNVKFSESTLDFSESNTDEMKERAKLNRAKNCVVVKRIVVKSRIPTKTDL